jgi:hypothetical protein
VWFREFMPFSQTPKHEVGLLNLVLNGFPNRRKMFLRPLCRATSVSGVWRPPRTAAERLRKGSADLLITTRVFYGREHEKIGRRCTDMASSDEMTAAAPAFAMGWDGLDAFSASAADGLRSGRRHAWLAAQRK